MQHRRNGVGAKAMGLAVQAALVLLCPARTSLRLGKGSQHKEDAMFGQGRAILSGLAWAGRRAGLGVMRALESVIRPNPRPHPKTTALFGLRGLLGSALAVLQAQNQGAHRRG